MVGSTRAGNIRINFRRAVLMGVLGAFAVVGMTACGSSTATPIPPTATTAPATATTVPKATATTEVKPTNTAITEPMVIGTPTLESMLMDMPTEAPTQVADAPPATAVTPSSQNTSDTAVSAVLREWAIDLSTSEIQAGDVTFTVTNKGTMGHNLTVLDSTGTVLGATPTFRGSQGSQTLEVTLAPGTYTLICSLPGHAAQGQKTTLVVK